MCLLGLYWFSVGNCNCDSGFISVPFISTNIGTAYLLPPSALRIAMTYFCAFCSFNIGLDIYKHGEPAYPLSAYGHGWLDDVKTPTKGVSYSNGGELMNTSL